MNLSPRNEINKILNTIVFETPIKVLIMHAHFTKNNNVHLIAGNQASSKLIYYQTIALIRSRTTSTTHFTWLSLHTHTNMYFYVLTNISYLSLMNVSIGIFYYIFIKPGRFYKFKFKKLENRACYCDFLYYFALGQRGDALSWQEAWFYLYMFVDRKTRLHDTYYSWCIICPLVH